MKTFGIALAAAGLAVGVAAQAVDLPDDAGAKLVETHCTTCHGLDLVTAQPRGKGEAFWAANVEKMIDTHGAEIPDGDRRAIIAYLGRSFG